MKYIKSFRFWLAFIVIFYTLAGFVLIPWIITNKLPGILKDKTGINLHVQKAKFNPYSFELDLGKINLDDLDNKPVINIDRVYLNYDLIGLFNKNILLNKIIINNPSLHVKLDKEGKLNLLNIIKPDTAKTKESKKQKTESPLTLLLRYADIKNGSISFDDLSKKKPFHFLVDNLNYKIVDLSTQKGAIAAQHLETKLDKTATMILDSGISLNPLKLYGELYIKNLNLKELVKYQLPNLNAELKSALLNLKIPYNLNLSKGFDFTVNKAYLTLENIDLRQKKQKTVSLKKLWIKDLDFSLPEKSITIENIYLDSPFANVILYKNSKINLADIMPVSKKENRQNSSQKQENSNFNYLIKNVNLKKGDINFADKKANNKILFSALNIYIKNVSSDKKIPINYKLSTGINKNSKLEAEGLFLQNKKIVEASVKLKNLNLSDFQAYIKPYANIKIQSAYLDIYAKATLKLNKKPDIDLRSDIELKKLSLSKSNENKLISFENLKVEKVSFSTSKNSLEIKAITLEKPYVNLEIAKDHTTNFSGIAKENKKSEQKDTKDKKVSENPLKIYIGPMALKNAHIDFKDESLPIPFKTSMSKLYGDMSSLDFQSSKPSKLSLKGVVGKYGYANVSGELLPLEIKNSANLKIQLKNLDLPTLTPYSGKFVGYAIKSGKLSLDLSYKIKNSSMIGDNKINLDSLTLGDKIESKDALNVPLGLAIAILKDSNGQIDIDLPITGNLNDPKFSYSKIVWRAIGNLIVGIVTSPFRFLGSMLGIDTEKLKAIDFALGSSKFVSSEMEKINAFKKMLSKRPGIKLIINGAYDQELDTKALQLGKIETMIKTEEEKLKKNKNNKQDIYAKAIENLYISKFSKTKYMELNKKFTTVKKDKKGKEIKTLDLISLNEELKTELASNIKIPKKELEKLAQDRIETIIKIISQNGIPKTRLKKGKIENKAAKRGKWIECAISIGT